MYQQYVYGYASCCPLVVMSYKLCVDIYFITKIYLSTKIYFIGGCGGHGLTSTLCICILLLKVKCCILVDDYRISKTPVELPTFLFNGNYRSPSFAFEHQHLSPFSDVHYLVTTVKFF